MGGREQINPGHTRVRKAFRVLGPALAAAGLICIVIAFVNFARAFGHFDRSPTLFWLFFLGAPLLFVGVVLTNAGYMGAVTRYVAQEQAPVAADTINYLASETAPAARTLAGALREGLSDSRRACPACAASNDPDARFCDSCGRALHRVCAACQKENDPDAKFCDACGRPVA